MLRLKRKTSEEVRIPDELRDGKTPERLLELLCRRGIGTKEAAARYLNPRREDLYDPMLMQDMAAAVETVRGAVAGGERITVFGDYDVDGVSATAILTDYLRGIGADVRYYIPDRHGEGYGLNLDAVEKIAAESKLLITVDCGITSVREVARARELGMRVIVTDHHRLPQEIPQAEAVLNPLLGGYPFRRLCGAGVAFKLVQALGGDSALEPYWDLAALATIADIVPLLDENRVIVSVGLAEMRRGRRPGLSALAESAATQLESLSASDVAFRIAPRINAGGRLALASRSVELLTTPDGRLASEIARELNGDNEKRRDLELEIFRQADERVQRETDFLRERVILVKGEGWETGVIGLAAARLVEKYRWPCILFSEKDGLCVGSARSIPGVDIHKALSACGPIFERFGGHAQAAGLTIRSERLPLLRERLNAAIRQDAEPEAFIPTEEYDLDLELSEISEELVEAFGAMQPTGFGNPQPLFCLRGVHTSDVRAIGREGAHLRLRLSSPGCACPAIGFRMGEFADTMPDSIEAVVNLGINTWMGRRTVQCELKRSQAYIPIKTYRMQAEQLKPTIDFQIAKTLSDSTSRYNIEASVRQINMESLKSVLESLIIIGNEGVLLCTHSCESLTKIAPIIPQVAGPKIEINDDYSKIDYAFFQPNDIRLFNTMLMAPDWEKINLLYKDIIVLDGFICSEERNYVVNRFKASNVIEVIGNSNGVSVAARRIIPSDSLLERIWHLLERYKQISICLERLIVETGATENQVRCALMIFKELGILDFENSPFSYRINGKKNNRENSKIRKRLQSLVNAANE